MATDIIARGMITEYIAGTNINFTENRDGTVEISASGSISSEDSVARDAIGNHKSDTSNPHNVTPAQIGLGNVDNTSDLDKPISTAVQKAIDNKADKTTATTDTDGLMSAEDKGKLDNADDTYALKSIYDDSTLNLGRRVNSEVGQYSIVIGRNLSATKQGAVAEGMDNTASGYYSHAEGSGTTASGYNSHSEGWLTTASGEHSHAGGRNSMAYGFASFAHGHYVNAYSSSDKNAGHAAFGMYNSANTHTLFSIGDGTADDARHNAFEITTDGGKLHDKDIATMNDLPNPNLLINPDFRINQRGISGVFSDTGKYFVDRWRLVSGTVTVNADRTITLNGSICQILENAVGTNVTASVSAGTAAYDDAAKTFTITGDGNIISWAKLEYGNAATPFVTPDPETELLKCCRYFQMIDNGTPAFGIVTDSTRIRMMYNLICPMRKNPTVNLLRHTGNFTWTFRITNASGTSYSVTTDFSTMSASLIRYDGTTMNIYINVPHTLSTNEIIYAGGSGGIYFLLDAEI